MSEIKKENEELKEVVEVVEELDDDCLDEVNGGIKFFESTSRKTKKVKEKDNSKDKKSNMYGYTPHKAISGRDR